MDRAIGVIGRKQIILYIRLRLKSVKVYRFNSCHFAIIWKWLKARAYHGI